MWSFEYKQKQSKLNGSLMLNVSCRLNLNLNELFLGSKHWKRNLVENDGWVNRNISLDRLRSSKHSFFDNELRFIMQISSKRVREFWTILKAIFHHRHLQCHAHAKKVQDSSKSLEKLSRHPIKNHFNVEQSLRIYIFIWSMLFCWSSTAP